MRLPSLNRVASAAGRTARRFPLVLAFALVAAASGVLLVDSSTPDDVYERLLYASTLGLPLFVGLKLLIERRRAPAMAGLLIQGCGILVLVVVYFLQPGWSEEVAALRYIQLSAGFHLFASFAPFLGRAGTVHGFWQYNRILFLRAVTTFLFAGVLFAGLAGALAAVDNLLGFAVEDQTYARLWFIIAFVFSTWFFLSGFPDDLDALDRETEYPAVIKVFSQYILTPIVTVYLLILTAYLGKILITRVWPSGWIGYLVSGVAVAGILSLLLVYPIQDREENRWVGSYGKWFYVAMLPAIAMLLLAIWQRIDQYGVTEKRYFLVVLSLWLAGIALFYILSRSRNIKVIPLSLCLVSLATITGPWGAYSVSRRSQIARLERILATNDMLADGQVRPAPAAVSFEDRRELGATIRYLAQTHGTAAINPLFGGRLAEIDTVGPDLKPSSPGQAEQRAELIVASLGLEYAGSWVVGLEDQFNFFARHDGAILALADYDFGLRDWSGDSGAMEHDGRSYQFELDAERSVITMLRDGMELIEVPLDSAVQQARNQQRSGLGRRGSPAAALRVLAENEAVTVAVYLRALRGTISGPTDGAAPGGSAADSYRITNVTADFYWSEKNR